MITIRIESDRQGEGATTTAMRIVRFLRLLGFDATYRGSSPGQEQLINDEIDLGREPLVGAEPRRFEVIDEGWNG